MEEMKQRYFYYASSLFSNVSVFFLTCKVPSFGWEMIKLGTGWLVLIFSTVFDYLTYGSWRHLLV
jgi:hypothetical protein